MAAAGMQSGGPASIDLIAEIETLLRAPQPPPRHVLAQIHAMLLSAAAPAPAAPLAAPAPAPWPKRGAEINHARTSQIRALQRRMEHTGGPAGLSMGSRLALTANPTTGEAADSDKPRVASTFAEVAHQRALHKGVRRGHRPPERRDSLPPAFRRPCSTPFRPHPQRRAAATTTTATCGSTRRRTDNRRRPHQCGPLGTRCALAARGSGSKRSIPGTRRRVWEAGNVRTRQRADQDVRTRCPAGRGPLWTACSSPPRRVLELLSVCCGCCGQSLIERS